jgi:hypothetical protein
MSDDVYRKLATVLDTLPNGFPSREDELEIRLPEKIFTPEQAELFCDLRLSYESVEQIAERTRRPLEGLEEKLITMRETGQLLGMPLGETWVFKIMPWVLGIFEMQVEHMDRELAEMTDEYHRTFGPQFFSNTCPSRKLPTVSCEPRGKGGHASTRKPAVLGRRSARPAAGDAGARRRSPRTRLRWRDSGHPAAARRRRKGWMVVTCQAARRS